MERRVNVSYVWSLEEPGDEFEIRRIEIGRCSANYLKATLHLQTSTAFEKVRSDIWDMGIAIFIGVSRSIRELTTPTPRLEYEFPKGRGWFGEDAIYAAQAFLFAMRIPSQIIHRVHILPVTEIRIPGKGWTSELEYAQALAREKFVNKHREN